MVGLRRLCRSVAHGESARLAGSASVLAALCVVAGLFATHAALPRAVMLTAASSLLAVAIGLLHQRTLLVACSRTAATWLCAATAIGVLLGTRGPIPTDAAVVFASTLGWDLWLLSTGRDGCRTTALPTLAFASALLTPFLLTTEESDPVTWAIILGCALVSLARGVGAHSRSVRAGGGCGRFGVLWSASRPARWVAALLFAGTVAMSSAYAPSGLAAGQRNGGHLYAVGCAWALSFLGLGDLILGAITAGIVVAGAIASFGVPAAIGGGLTSPSPWGAPLVIGITLASMLTALRTPPRRSRHADHRAFSAALGLACVALAWTPFVFLEALGGTTAVAVVSGLAVASIAQSSIVSALLTRLLSVGSFAASPGVEPGSREHHDRVLARFKHLSPNVRGWAYGKLLFDPMFPKLAEVVPHEGRVLDVGCGLGLADAWLAALRPELSFHGFDPDPHRVLIAKHILGNRASVRRGRIENPMHPWSDEPFDVALCLDVLHQVARPDAALASIASALRTHATLVVRTTIVLEKESLAHIVERWMVRSRGQPMQGFFSAERLRAMLDDAGFDVVLELRAGRSRPETLFVARKRACSSESID